MRRGDDARFRPLGALRADGLELAILENAQQLALKVERRVADLVEKDGAAAGDGEASAPVVDGAGERAAHVAEQLGLEQSLGKRGAVDRHERLARRCGERCVDRARDELLARAALAADQDRRAAWSPLGRRACRRRSSRECGRRVVKFAAPRHRGRARDSRCRTRDPGGRGRPIARSGRGRAV